MTEHKIPIPSMLYNASVGGHVTNSQQIIDENLNREQNDINQETVGAVPYNSITPNGMGRIVLKKNDNFKEVVESQTNGNTIFVIKYDFILTGNVIIPANCVLKFDGGSINGQSINLNNADIISPLIPIFKGTSLSALYNKEIHAEWFNIMPDTTVDSAVIANLIRYCHIIRFGEGTFNFTNPITISDNDSIFAIIGAEHGRDRFPITVFSFTNCNGFDITVGAKRFENLSIIGNNIGTWNEINKIYTDTKSGINSTQAFGINKCAFSGFGYGIRITNGDPVSLKITNCEFGYCLNDAIYIDAALNHCLIQGCYIHLNGRYADNNTLDSTEIYSGHGINIGSGNAVLIINNVFEYNAGCGIYVMTPRTPVAGLHATIIGNDFEHNKYTQIYINRNVGYDKIDISNNFYTDANISLPNNALAQRGATIIDDNSIYPNAYNLENLSYFSLINSRNIDRKSMLYNHLNNKDRIIEDGEYIIKTSSAYISRANFVWEVKKDGIYTIAFTYKVDTGGSKIGNLHVNINGEDKGVQYARPISSTTYEKVRTNFYKLNAGDIVYVQSIEFPSRTYNYIWVKDVVLEEANNSGTTEERPTLSNDASGFLYYNTTTEKLELWNGTTWVNATGATV